MEFIKFPHLKITPPTERIPAIPKAICGIILYYLTNFVQYHHLLVLDQNEINLLWKDYNQCNHKAPTYLVLVPKLYPRKYY